MSGWLVASLINTLTVVVGPMVTPWLNQHVVGSGIIGAYFAGSAVIAAMITILSTGHIQSPDPWVLLSGFLFGAGVLSVQKATERSPEPALAVAIPSTRAFLTATLAFVVLGSTTSFVLGSSYVIQAAMSVILILVAREYNPRTEPEPWYMYAGIAAALLSVSDIILKYSGSFDTVLGDTSWFAMAGSVLPLVMNYVKTGSVFPAYRDKGTVDQTRWWTVLAAMVVVFYIRVITQVLSISLAPNPALPRIVGSLAIPLVALYAWYTKRYRVTIQEGIVLVVIAVVSASSGYIATISQ